MKNGSSRRLATLSLLAALSGCLAPTESADEISSVEQHTFAGSIGVALGSPVATGSTTGATDDFTPTCLAGISTASDATYIWTAPATDTFVFTTFGSGYDTALEVREFNTLTSLGCNDDSNGTLQSLVAASLTAGQTLLLVVDGFATATGPYNLNITQGAAITHEPALSASERTAVAAALERKYNAR